MAILARFLVGDRDAILKLASERTTVWAGLLFVLAAGLAREYDGVDLTHEPWWLLIPPVASVAVSLVLFVVVYGRSRLGRKDGAAPSTVPATGFWANYRAFLGLFWMTAPLAFLYAIPYERFLTPGPATRANLATLALVALWRVLLITRVLSVLTGRGMGALFFVVMLLADFILVPAVAASPRPVFDIMGGVRLSDREMVLQSTSMLTAFLGVISMPVWLIGAGVALRRKMSWNVPPTEAARNRPALVALGGASVAIFAMLLVEPQREQRLRTRVERDLRQGRIVEALATMSTHAPGDFPPQWDPPPRPAFDRDDPPPLLDVLEAIDEQGAPEWVRAIYVGKLERTYLQTMFVIDGVVDEAKWARVERVLDKLPEGPAVRAANANALRRIRESFDSVRERNQTQPSTAATTQASARESHQAAP